MKKHLFAIAAFVAFAATGSATVATFQDNTFPPSENGIMPSNLQLVSTGGTGGSAVVKSFSAAGLTSDHTGGDGYVLEISTPTGSGSWSFLVPAGYNSVSVAQQRVTCWIYVNLAGMTEEKSYGLFADMTAVNSYPTGYFGAAATASSSWGGWAPTNSTPFLLARPTGSTSWTQISTNSGYTVADGWHLMTLTYQGGTLTSTLDGTQVCTGASTAVASGWYSFGVYVDPGNAGSKIIIDNFKMENLNAPDYSVSAATDWNALQ